MSFLKDGTKAVTPERTSTWNGAIRDLPSSNIVANSDIAPCVNEEVISRAEFVRTRLPLASRARMPIRRLALPDRRRAQTGPHR